MIHPKLKNGADVLASRKTRDGWVVLAKRAVGEFVTWCVDNNGSAFWGHYFGLDYDKACNDFASRAGI